MSSTPTLCFLGCIRINCVKAEKCEFHQDTIMFLGYVISQRGVEMDSSKVQLQDRSGSVPTTLDPGEDLPVCILLPKIVNGRSKLQCGEQRAPVHQDGQWQHWLEGVRHPFLVLTDHCNLEYLHNAKRLNPRQGQWALFFMHFQYSVTYQPGTKNGKADALSHCHDPISSPKVPEHILPSLVLLTLIRWDRMEEIQQAHVNEPPTHEALCAHRTVAPGIAMGPAQVTQEFTRPQP
ncbi:hypothetical protein QTP70_009043 [Hemibagrus guttatus]|uniref:Reverse transcriptase RNase H-like domain-containing protein n=1 Tax=Hemibagrus guttatus TaxID=175788 RepID=A0AAE0R1E7_9TELE|nr:hypothetical protein QTP70_009043 [Hemibagrus guttatus]